MDVRADGPRAVRLTKEEKQILKKQMKTSCMLLRHEGISTTNQPTKSLVVANGGLGNSVIRKDLCAALTQMGEVEMLLMPPQKPYAFVTYRSAEGAQKAHSLLNRHQLPCGAASVTLYLSFIHSVPREPEVRVSLPEGLVLIDDFVSEEEELLLLAAVDWSSSNDVTCLPEVCFPVLDRCVRNGYTDILPDQLTVNLYMSGQGIPPHVDTHSAFEDTILSLSLGSKVVMEFRHPDGCVAPVLLPRRSLLVMKGESRYLWSHGITPRQFDMVPACYPQCPVQTTSDLTLSRRDTRTSFTFRKIRHGPCCCVFPSVCDSQRAPLPSLPCCSADATHLEEVYVHRVYNSIASHFSSTRHSPWPGVCHFLSSLPAGSVLADVGCGNGKYLAVNPEVTTVGCDRSGALLDLCGQKGHQVFISDALSVPLRSSSCDACISIAVIHHFSTQERRLAAVRELVRLLKPGGQALVYVWAFEQQFNQHKSKYLKEPKDREHGKQGPPTHKAEESVQSTNHAGSSKSPCELSVHINRTAFSSQDLLVPWHLKGGKPGNKHLTPHSSQHLHTNTASVAHNTSTNPQPESVFHRYYHIFQQGELESLCAQLTAVRVTRSFHEQGNWCVVLERE
ncbi:tRNA (carboxymethyluridine(34)-5-O)-methyltransferase alkbh8 isoform X2 [Genypterus blacodes]|uniref:tRNA (carboxymethyluridine(34)-5-O)-methyltransferase alkbh8 isoform X2 n=1 Tax=Genypterus blacodes TaxID=154954 RepID=UPI003F77721C